MPERLRLVQVGAGRMGQAWLATIGECADVELVGLVDLDVEAAHRALAQPDRPADEPTRRETPSVVVAGSLEEVLTRVEADAVVNVTVPEAHREVSTLALLHGLDVLCEKPAADTTAAALSMAAASEVSGRLLMVSQSRRYVRTLDALRTQLAHLGTLGLAECSFFRAPHFGGFREQMPYPLLTDMAIHQFDLVRDLLGDDPVWVSCESFNPPWSWFAGDAAAQVSAGFARGARFSFTGSWCAPGAETSWNGAWRINGERGSAIWDGDHDPYAEDADGRPIAAEPGADGEGIAGALAEFVDALRTGAVPATEVHVNVVSLAMVEAAIRSAQTERRVRVDEVLDEAYATALTDEQRPELAETLAGWGSARGVAGRGSAVTRTHH